MDYGGAPVGLFFFHDGCASYRRKSKGLYYTFIYWKRGVADAGGPSVGGRNLHTVATQTHTICYTFEWWLLPVPFISWKCVSTWKCFPSVYFFFWFIVCVLVESICAPFFPPLNFKSKEYRDVTRERESFFKYQKSSAAHSMNFHQSGTSSPVFHDDRSERLILYKKRKNKSCESESNWRDNHTERSGRTRCWEI